MSGVRATYCATAASSTANSKSRPKSKKELRDEKKAAKRAAGATTTTAPKPNKPLLTPEEIKKEQIKEEKLQLKKERRKEQLKEREKIGARERKRNSSARGRSRSKTFYGVVGRSLRERRGGGLSVHPTKKIRLHLIKCVMGPGRRMRRSQSSKR